jgi:hypothetical protein
LSNRDSARIAQLTLPVERLAAGLESREGGAMIVARPAVEVRPFDRSSWLSGFSEDRRWCRRRALIKRHHTKRCALMNHIVAAAIRATEVRTTEIRRPIARGSGSAPDINVLPKRAIHASS